MTQCEKLIILITKSVISKRRHWSQLWQSSRIK